MKLYFFIMASIVTLLTNCGYYPIHEVSIYAVEFCQIYNIEKGRPCRKPFGWHFKTSLPSGSKAECKAGLIPRCRRIYISRQWWDNASVMQRRAVIFHEMGHGNLRRGHCTAYNFQEKRRVSLMSPQTPNDNDLINYWDDYVHELFNKSKHCEG